MQVMVDELIRAAVESTGNVSATVHPSPQLRPLLDISAFDAQDADLNLHKDQCENVEVRSLPAGTHATTRASALPSPSLRNSEITFVSSCTSAKIGKRVFDADTRRLEVDIGQTWHGQRLHKTATLPHQPPIILHAEQHMRRFAPVGDEYRPRLRCPLGVSDVLLQFATCYGRHGHM